jgi:tetratricopeptide (TPR) repeat protein
MPMMRFLRQCAALLVAILILLPDPSPVLAKKDAGAAKKPKKAKKAKRGKKAQEIAPQDAPPAPASTPPPAPTQDAPAPASAPTPAPASTPDAPAQAGQAAPAPAAKDSAAAAERTFAKGQEHYQKKEYEQAIAAFTEGYGTYPDPVFLYNIAQAYRQWEKPAEAIRFYEKYLEQSPQARNRAVVEERIAALRSQVPAPPAPVPVKEKDKDEEARERALELAREARGLAREGKAEAAVARAREAIRLGQGARMPAEDLAILHYNLGTLHLKAGDDDEAVAALRRAGELSPADPDMRLDLATALLRTEDYDGAVGAAEQALRLGLSGEDAGDARSLIKEARSQRLHERLTFDATVSYSYDSNVTQGGAIQTIAGKTTAASNTSQRPRIERIGGTSGDAEQNYANLVNANYRTASPQATSEWDMPLYVNLSLLGRPVGGRRAELWLGYRFAQTFMTMTVYDHDAYNYQEHFGTVRLQLRPWSWLSLRLRADGFVNFSGLKSFTPFQGGVNGYLDAIFYESKRWNTRINYRHNFRMSFDRTNDAYLDGNRDDVGVSQELRTRYFRPRLGYTFHNDLTGVLSSEVPLVLPVPTLPRTITPTSLASTAACYESFQAPELGMNPVSTNVWAGCYKYQAPLGYRSHEAYLTLLFTLPWQLDISSTVRYEYRDYAGQNTAVYHATETTFSTMVNGQQRNVTFNLSAPITLMGQERRDHLINADLYITKTLPLGFSVELSYAFTMNKSSIANGLDNRNWDKHVVTLSGYWSF